MGFDARTEMGFFSSPPFPNRFLGLHRLLSSGKWTPCPWKLKVKARSQQLIVPCNFKMCSLGTGSTVHLLVNNYIEQWSSGAADSHLLHQETPCLIKERQI